MAVSIRVLPDNLINKIAAGEVVDRPASVVKELVENSLDAGATEIQVEVAPSGRSLLRVIDNGSGMTRDDAVMSIERHATSKLGSDSDLFAISTLGFRGEALAAISGVSRFELRTRRADAAAGTAVQVMGGTLHGVVEVGCPVGTEITVRDLFFNTPARLKFLKSPGVEIGHIVEIMTQLALSRPGVGLRLTRDTETLLDVSSHSEGRDRLAEVLGRATLQHLHPFEVERAGMGVKGWLSAPELTRAGWSSFHLFVNGRCMRDRLLMKSVSEAYRGVVPKGRYPVVVLYLDLPLAEVDVNVHPGKLEARFARARQLSELVVDTLRSVLVKAPWQGRSSPPPRPTPREVVPHMAETGPRWGEDPGQLASSRWKDALAAVEKVAGGEGTVYPEVVAQPVFVAPPVPISREREVASSQPGNTRPPRTFVETWSAPAVVASAEVPPAAPAVVTSPLAPPQTTRPDPDGLLPLHPPEATFSRMRVIGQYGQCFMLLQEGDDLVLIDQHAAHERVTFEKLRRAYEGVGSHSQALLIPKVVEVGRREAELLAEHLPELQALGLDVEPFGGKSFAIKGLPAVLVGEDPAALLIQLAHELAGEISRAPLADLIHHLLSTMACHTSVRASQTLTVVEMEGLLKSLDGTPLNYACPHGRPLLARFSRREVERLFKRS